MDFVGIIVILGAFGLGLGVFALGMLAGTMVLNRLRDVHRNQMVDARKRWREEASKELQNIDEDNKNEN